MAKNDSNYKTTTKKKRPRRSRPGDSLRVGGSENRGGGYMKKTMNRNF